MLRARSHAYTGAFMNVGVHVAKGGDMKRSSSVLKRGTITGFVGAATAAKVIQDPRLEADGKDDCGESDAV
jgi:hypothetical protein